jgi:hypothetical protein
LWVQLNKHVNNIKQLFFKYDSASYPETSLQKDKDESAARFRQREIERQIGLFIQQAKRPQLDLLPSKVCETNNPALLLTTAKQQWNLIQTYQGRILHKFRKLTYKDCLLIHIICSKCFKKEFPMAFNTSSTI